MQQYFFGENTEKNTMESNRYLTLHGWIGSGKTTLALHYGHTYAKAPYTMVWWIDATSKDTIQDSFRKIRLHLGGKDVHDEKSSEYIREKLQIHSSKASNKKGEHWLVIWDNINEESLKTFLHYDNANLYASMGGHILLTTRNLNLIEGKSIWLDALTEDEAIKLLELYHNPELNDEASTQLIHTTRQLPLALAELGHYMKGKSNPKECLDMIHEEPLTFQKELKTIPSYSQKKTLRQGLQESVQKASQISKKSEKLIRSLAYYSPQIGKKFLRTLIPKASNVE